MTCIFIYFLNDIIETEANTHTETSKYVNMTEKVIRKYVRET